MTTTPHSNARITLEALARGLRARLRDREGAQIEQHADVLDAALETSRREAWAMDAARTRRKLAEVDAALDRIGTGHYGICCDCDEDISEQRLACVPEAAYCVGCQSEREAR